MKVYIAGPMTGYPQFNVPAFREAAEYLRDLGREVISPVELDPLATQAAALASTDGKLEGDVIAGEHYKDILARCIAAVYDADALVLLDGWHASRGARIEALTALVLGKPCYEWVDRHIKPWLPQPAPAIAFDATARL